jgi:hypothetical protein
MGRCFRWEAMIEPAWSAGMDSVVKGLYWVKRVGDVRAMVGRTTDN